MTIMSCQVHSNAADGLYGKSTTDGGGLYGAGGTVKLGNGTAFSNNSATTGRGAVSRQSDFQSCSEIIGQLRVTCDSSRTL